MRHKREVVVLIVLGLFLLPLFNPITEGLFQSSNITGLKTSTNANFYAISESDNPTRWILQEASLSAVEDFHDDINTDYWNLGDVSDIDFDVYSFATGDSYVSSSSPDSNYNHFTFISIRWDEPEILRSYIEFDNFDTEYLFNNESGNYQIGLKCGGITNPNTDTVQCYNTSDFVESEITWNNAPVGDTLQYSLNIGDSAVWKYWDFTNLNSKYLFKWTTESGVLHSANFVSREHGNYQPRFTRKDVSKNYFGSGYMYMQTDIYELISLKSKDYGGHKTLSSGDYFEIDFQTSSDSQINLILLKDGVVNKTLVLSQSGNTNFNRHTAQISVNEDVEFDQLKISSTFGWEDYIKVWDIKTFKYTIAGDYADFVVGSKRTHMVNMDTETYNLRIFDPYDSEVKVNVNVTIGTDDYFYEYIPSETLDCRLTLFNIGKESSLNFVDYHIDINRSLNGEWDVFELLENIFTADVGSRVYINVSDRFDTLIDSIDKLASSYIDLELEVYQLQIKNLMTEKTILNINSSLFVHPLLSGDSIFFILSTAYYTIQYYDTNNMERQFTIYLDSNQAYELNRSQICFLSYTDEQGNHLFFEDYMTYLNGSLIYEKVFYEEIGTDVHINITDRYGINLYIGTYTVLASDNYIPIILEVYELKLMNMQNEFNSIVIERAPYPIVGTVGDVVESGHFPATYSFTDDIVGEDPTEGSPVISEVNEEEITVISEYDGHKKVLYLEGNNGGNNFISYYFNEPFETGTVEFWLYHEDLGDDEFDMAVWGDTERAMFGWLTGWVYTHDGITGYNTIAGSGSYKDKWTHFKIDINKDTWDLYLDGVFKRTTNIRDDESLNSFTHIQFLIPSWRHVCLDYVDAIGIGTDPNYNIGDNLHDSYYLGYEPFEAYNQTTEGDYTGTESFDYYTEEGVFYGTYDFRDEVGETGEDIDLLDNIQADGYAEVITSYNNHIAVLNLTTTGASGIWHYVSANPTSGTVEFYCKSTVGTPVFRFRDSGGNIMLYVYFYSDGTVRVVYGDGAGGTIYTGYYTTITNFPHFKIEFDCTTDTFSVWCEGILLVDDENFALDLDADYLDRTRWYFGDVGECYVDAYGESWDTTSHGGYGYEVGHNTNPYDIVPLLESGYFDVLYFIYGTQMRITNVDGHINVLKMLNNDTIGSRPLFYNLFSGGETGTVEFWARTSNNGVDYINLGGNNFQLIISSNELYYFEGGVGVQYVCPFIADNWYHIKLVYDCNGGVDSFADIYVNGTLEWNDAEFKIDTGNIDRFYVYQSDNNLENYLWLDAVGYSVDGNYDIGNNINSHGHDVIDELKAGGCSFSTYPLNSIGISGEFNNHKKFINMTDGSPTTADYIFLGAENQPFGTIEFYFKQTTTTKVSYFILRTPVWPDQIGMIRIDANGLLKWAGDVQTTLQSYSANIWYHIRIDFECGSGGYMGLAPDTVDIYIDDVLKGNDLNFIVPTDMLYQVNLLTHNAGYNYSFYVDAISYSWDSGYYVGDNYNFYDVESEYSWTTNIAPDEVVSFRLLKGFYNIWMTNSEETISYSFRMFDDNYFVLNSSQMCFLSYTNQRGEYLEFNQFKTYWNGTLLYENVFYEWIGKNASIEIKDHYDISVKNHSFIVSSGDNYVPVILTMYSLKIMNQQEIFNHINITRDPNYYDSDYFWSEWIAPNEIIEFNMFAGYYKINLTDNENSGSSYYSYTLNGDDVLLISSGNTISNLIINIANVNTTIGNQITNVQIDLTNQNSNINNTIINIEINLSNVNSSIGNLLTNINLDIININNNISNLYTFTENNFLNLGNNINNSFISITNNIIAINQTISTLVIGLDGKITVVNATITTMFTEMNSQFIVVQSTLDFSFAFLNQTIVQIGNNITNNQIALNNLIIQRANDIDNSIIQIQTLINLLNSTVANESLVVQTLVNIIGSNITENHVVINNLINLLGNNITENNINLVSLIELVGNNITTNHFVIQTLIDYVSNNITDNHLEFLTNINLINNTIGQNQIELINRLLFINNSINEMALDLTNQIILVNNTIYSAILDVSVSIDFNSDNILGNISLTYQQNDFLTNLYRTTMFSQLLNWSGVAYNYTLMEDRIDVWEFVNKYKDGAGIVFLRYNDLIDNLTVSAQNTIEQFLPKEDVEYRVWSIKDQKYLDEWQPLPENRTVDFGFYEEEISGILDFNAPVIWLMIVLILLGCGAAIVFIGYIANRYRKKSENYRRSYADKITLEAKTIKKFTQGTRIR